MTIRKATTADIPQMAAIYEKAKAFMRSRGNMHQWADGYPSADSAEKDIDAGRSYVCVTGGRIAATFFFLIGDDPTYKVIEGGSWLNERPYGVLHRVASDGSESGMLHRILDYCFSFVPDIRIDTHRDNLVMQEALLRYGFTYCGIIHLANGDERLAYQCTKGK